MISTNVSQTNNTILQRNIDILTHKLNQAIDRAEQAESKEAQTNEKLNKYVAAFTTNTIIDQKNADDRTVTNIDEAQAWNKQSLLVTTILIRYDSTTTNNTSTTQAYLVVNLAEPFVASLS